MLFPKYFPKNWLSNLKKFFVTDHFETKVCVYFFTNLCTKVKNIYNMGIIR